MSEQEKQDRIIAAGTIAAPLEPYIPEGLVAQFASQFNFTDTGNEVYLSFYQPEIPFIDEQHQSVEKIKSRCVARVVLTRPALKALADLLNKASQQILVDANKVGND